jgi:hypothetical protein
MQTPDIRQQMLEIVLEMLDDYAVTDFEMVVATAFHRPMSVAEVKRMVGTRIFNKYWPDRLYNHDAELPGGLTYLGKTAEGYDVEISTRAAESDLVIYLNLTFVPMNGGYKSVGTGLAGYKTLLSHHNPYALRKTKTYMDPKDSHLSNRMASIGKFINEKLDVFHIESTVNNQMFAKPLDFLGKNEDELTKTEERAMKVLIRTLNFLPQPARQAIFEKVPAPYGVIGVYAGETMATHEKILDKCFQQLAVPVKGQSDIVIFPIPYISPYNVGAFLNPLLVSVMAEGYLYNLHRGAPLLKKGGTIIITHPSPTSSTVSSTLPTWSSSTSCSHRPGTRWSCTSASSGSSAGTRHLSKCTDRARHTTRPTRSTCGTGERTAASTAAVSSSLARTTSTSPPSSDTRPPRQ